MPEDTPPPEATALFAVTGQGRVPFAEVVGGIAGVADAVGRAVQPGAGGAPDDLAALLASLEDPAAWAAHGRGDGRPFWHWWARLAEGSVTAQRLTAALPTAEDPPGAEVAGALAGCAAELRALAGMPGRKFRLGPQT